jgi:hypothetical protein
MSYLSLSSCRPIHGLIFLFKWVQDDEPIGSVVQDTRLDKIFFAKQVRKLDVFFLTPQSTILLGKLLVTQLVKFIAFYGTQMFTSVMFAAGQL